MDNKKKFAFSIPVAVAFLLSIASYFMPFFKVKGSSLLGSFGSVLEWSMIRFAEEAFVIADYEEDLGIILIVILAFLFLLPSLLALVGAIMSMVLKPRAGGVVTIITGAYGLITAILWRVLFSVEIDDGFFGSISLSDLMDFDVGAIINGLAFIVCIILGIVMVCFFKQARQSQSYEINSYQSGLMQDQDYRNQGYSNQSYGAQGYGGQSYEEPHYNNDDDNVTVRLHDQAPHYNNDDDSVTVRLHDQAPHYNNDDDNVTVRLHDQAPHEPSKKIGRIICTAGKFKGAIFPISDGETIFVGRDPKQCSIIMDKDCVYVGRKHCSFTYNADKNCYRICVYSKNGIILSNRERIVDGKEIVLPAGSSIALGSNENVMKLH